IRISSHVLRDREGPPLARRPLYFPAVFQRRSEQELDRHLDDPVALLERGLAEDWVILRECVLIEAKAEVTPVEGPQRMVQEVVPIEAELQRLPLLDLEVLEQCQIGVEEVGSVNGR